MIYRNVHLIYNSNAGKLIRNPALAERVRAELQQGGRRNVVMLPTAGPGDATKLAGQAAETGADLIVCMGGDGTVNEVLNGMVHSKVPLAVIPGGTANVFCCETGIPRNAEKAAGHLNNWVEARVGLGRIQTLAGSERHFLLMAGAGLDAGVVQRVEPGIKRKLGKLAYWIAGLRTFGSPLSILKVRAEGREFVTGFALSSRVRNYGGDLAIATKASLFSDGFELVTFSGRSTIPYGIYLAGAVVSRTTSLPGVQSLITRRIELLPVDGDPVYVQIDGEAAGQIPATIDFIPSALTILIPASARN